jgi:hypothetical protein
MTYTKHTPGQASSSTLRTVSFKAFVQRQMFLAGNDIKEVVAVRYMQKNWEAVTF